MYLIDMYMIDMYMIDTHLRLWWKEDERRIVKTIWSTIKNGIHAFFSPLNSGGKIYTWIQDN